MRATQNQSSLTASLPVLLTVTEAAERLRVSRSRVYELVEDRQLAHHRIGGARGAIRISETDLLSFLADSRVEPTADEPTPLPLRRSALKHIKL